MTSVLKSFQYAVTRSSWLRSLSTDQTFYENVENYWSRADQRDYISSVLGFSRLIVDDYEGILIKKYIGGFILSIYLPFFCLQVLVYIFWRLQSRLLSLKGKGGYILKFAVTVSPCDGAVVVTMCSFAVHVACPGRCTSGSLYKGLHCEKLTWNWDEYHFINSVL